MSGKGGRSDALWIQLCSLFDAFRFQFSARVVFGVPKLQIDEKAGQAAFSNSAVRNLC